MRIMSQLERGRRVLVAATTAAVILLSMAVMFHSDVAVAEAATYKIAWNENPDLSPLENKTVRAGDTLVFSYNNASNYNVIKVDIDRYTNCSGLGETVYHNGNDTFELARGIHYFICGAGGHCENNGMKVNVTAI